MKTAVVVGAGFAGLSAALELARCGVGVTVVEACDRPGGRAQRLTTPEGFSFDTGPTLIVMTDVLQSVLGAERFAALDLRRLEPGYRVRWADGQSFDLSSDIATLLQNVASFSPAPPASSTLSYLAEVHAQYREARARILDRDHDVGSFLRAVLRPGRFRPWAFRPLRSFVGKHFANTRVVDAMTFQTLYLGTSPLQAPALYAMLAVEEIVGGIWHAQGGTGAIVDALVAACRAHGVAFKYGMTADGIDWEGRRARRVLTRNGVLEADAFVVTADRDFAMRTFFPGIPIRHPRYGHSAYVWHLGVARTLAGPHHQVLLPNDPGRSYAQLDAGMLPEEPLIYCCNATVSDAGTAPRGGSALMLLSPVPNRQRLPVIDEKAYFARVLRTVESHFGSVADPLVFRRAWGPIDFERSLHVPYGAAFGPDHLLDQMGPLRPSIRHPRIDNLAFAGSGTHPGTGVPMVLLSGRIAARRLMRKSA